LNHSAFNGSCFRPREKRSPRCGVASRETKRICFQLIQIVERFLASDRLHIPSLFHNEPIPRRILMAFNLPDRSTRPAVCRAAEHDPADPDLRPRTAHLRDGRNAHLVHNQTHPGDYEVPHQSCGQRQWLEGYAATVLEAMDEVDAYAKNDHLGCQVNYMWSGSRRRFFPDFIVRMVNGKTLALEIKGRGRAATEGKARCPRRVGIRSERRRRIWGCGAAMSS